MATAACPAQCDHWSYLYLNPLACMYPKDITFNCEGIYNLRAISRKYLLYISEADGISNLCSLF